LTKAPENKVTPPANTQGTGRRIGLDHFNFLAVLGKGNFGKVMLAETKSTKQLYAIKVLKKEFIIENDEVESTRSEKRVFLIANKERHPFLLNLHACFQTETRVYFVMEYISGGDLMLHIQRGQFGTKRAQFYAAEVCLALKYFHENGVIYRDLKLDNILLTLDGHIKIADYGLCKEEMWYGSTTSTFCGTPEFMAPEILLDKKYGRAVDWWAFGVLIYQMLLQQSPFRGEDEDEIYDAILADEPLYPIHMPRDSVSILQKLLTREPELRLGSGPTDAQEIMSHAFFRNINWDDIYHKRVAPPFVPTITSATDTSNFDTEFTSVTPVLTPVQSVLSQAMQEEFRGFSYSADFN
jgi:classical protein kinase C